MWTIHSSAFAAFAVLCLSSRALGALMPRTSPVSTCFTCPPYTIVTGPGSYDSLWATMSTDPGSHHLVCFYTDHECTYDPTTGASNSADTGCPAQLVTQSFTCPTTVDGYSLTSATAEPAVTTCLYDDPDMARLGCKFNTDGTLYIDFLDNSCPSVAPVCSVSQGAGVTRRAKYKREDNFTAVMDKQRARRLDISRFSPRRSTRSAVS